MKNAEWTYFEPRFAYENKFDDFGWPWSGHKYFAYDLVRNLKPETIVELGTHKGTSFFSFCQAIQDGHLHTKIFAVDTWRGDAQAGFYGDEVFDTVRDIQKSIYPNVGSVLVRKTFDEAVGDFADRSIDLLHIDGLHTYEAVKHDFETWLPKVKENGIILLHDMVVTRDDFGVHRLWKELKQKHATLEFPHSYGLGVVCLAADHPLVGLKEQLEPRYAYHFDDVRNAKIAENIRRIQLQDKEIALMKASPFWKLREWSHRALSALFHPIRFWQG
jgi:hypothetical protein